MRIFLILIISIIFQSCSFDNKSGIWKRESISEKEEKDDFSQFEDLSSVKNTFNEEIIIKNDFKFSLPSSFNNSEWSDIFYNKTNNSKNFSFSELNRKSFKSKKISNQKINDYILYDNENIISTDTKGNIIVYSLTNKIKILNFNFYKKKFKKNIKKLNIITEENIIYVSDNLGYLYSLDYNNNKVLWAKNFKIPFRSNIKIFEDKLILSNQNNQIFYVDKNNGNILKLIPTEETTVKNKFINNISLDNDSTFFLNTFGSLYSIDNKRMQINWFINLNQTTNVEPSNLFLGNTLVKVQDIIVVSTNHFTYVIDSNTGTILFKKNFSSFIKPLIISKYLFLITKNDLLIALDLNSGQIIYSHNINTKISKFINTKRRKAEFKNIYMINSKLFIFLKNSYVIVFNTNGNIEKIVKLPSKINSQPIFIKDSMIFIDSRNRVFIIN